MQKPLLSKSALPKFVEKLEVCKDLFYPFDYSPFLDGSDLDRANTIVEGINFIIADQEKKQLFFREA